jgi:hypothetical protein
VTDETFQKKFLAVQSIGFSAAFNQLNSLFNRLAPKKID